MVFMGKPGVYADVDRDVGVMGRWRVALTRLVSGWRVDDPFSGSGGFSLAQIMELESENP